MAGPGELDAAIARVEALGLSWDLTSPMPPQFPYYTAGVSAPMGYHFSGWQSAATPHEALIAALEAYQK